MSQRIVSIVPSQTELLYDLGLQNEVVGITKFCIHPNEWFQSKQRVGGTKTLNLEKIDSLKPDLILANKEENTKEQVEYLASRYPTFISDISTVLEAFGMIQQIGELTHTENKAFQIIENIQTVIPESESHLASALYLIWKNPYMLAGQNTFINEMMRYAGFQNMITADRYPEISIQEILTINPEFILLSSEPFPFKEKHIYELQSMLPNSKVMLVDGEMFSWYGSRMQKAFHYFQTLRNF